MFLRNLLILFNHCYIVIECCAVYWQPYLAAPIVPLWFSTTAHFWNLCGQN